MNLAPRFFVRVRMGAWVSYHKPIFVVNIPLTGIFIAGNIH
jgi:hypothetical protein